MRIHNLSAKEVAEKVQQEQETYEAVFEWAFFKIAGDPRAADRQLLERLETILSRAEQPQEIEMAAEDFV